MTHCRATNYGTDAEPHPATTRTTKPRTTTMTTTGQLRSMLLMLLLLLSLLLPLRAFRLHVCMLQLDPGPTGSVRRQCMTSSNSNQWSGSSTHVHFLTTEINEQLLRSPAPVAPPSPIAASQATRGSNCYCSANRSVQAARHQNLIRLCFFSKGRPPRTPQPPACCSP